MSSARVDRLFYAEWGNPVGTAMDDVDAWYQANPALGIRVTEEALHDEYRTLVSGGDEELIAEFAREAVGIGEPPPEDDDRPTMIDEDEWRATATATRAPDGRVVLAYDVDLRGEFASIDLAAGHAAAPYLECIRHQPGTGWLGAELVGLVQRQEPIAVGYNAAGPALEQLGAIVVAFREAGLDADLLVPLSASQYRAAVGGLLSHISEGTLTRPKVSQTPLDLAAIDATERPLAEGRVFHRRNARVPISPIVAGAVACYLLPTPEAVAPEVAIHWF